MFVRCSASICATLGAATNRNLCSRFLAISLFLTPALFLASCKNEEKTIPSPAQVHEITRQMMRAAAGLGRQPGDIASRLQFDGNNAERSDHLFITLPAEASERSRRESVARLIQSLDRIATRNHLARDSDASSGALVRLDYRRAGVITNAVHIITPLGGRSPSATASQPDHHPGAARLAIILDDLGGDRAAADAIFALPYPLTLSVLPDHVHSIDISEDAHRRGYEVLLHLPMQSVGNEKPEAHELRSGVSPDDIPLLVDRMMQSVPEAVGVNNHQGSQATADRTLMTELMPVLRQWNLFYIDSRTTASTVAFDTAHQFGVRAAFRNVPFLDDVAEVSAVRKQVELAFRDANLKGEAIAIGHPHPATLQALSELLPQAEARGVRLVLVSSLVH